MRIQIPMFTGILACVTLLMVQPAAAQTYPVKPIRILIAQAPGSATDNVSRVITGKLTAPLGQQFIIEARPGAGGTIGTEAAARAPADGYTLFMANNSTHGANPAVYRNLSYDAVKDFAPIMLLAQTPYVLAAHPSLPVKNVKELIAFARARPGQLNYGSAGNGSTHHLAGELLKMTAKIDMVHVPYKGTTPGLTALLSGEVSTMFFTVVGIQPHMKSGKARGLAVTTAQRSESLPELPTMTEAGVPGFEITSWFGLLAPARTPPEIISRLNAELLKVQALPDVKAAMAKLGFDAVTGTPEQFAEHIRREVDKFTKLAKATGIKAE